MNKTDYIHKKDALEPENVLTVNTKDFGTIDVVPVEYLESLPVTAVRSEKECPPNGFCFNYGRVAYKHRFSINRSLDDYEETTLNRCISMGVQYKYKTMACDKLIAEMQIVYKDENGKLHCLCEDLHDFTFSILHKGDMQIHI